MNSYFKLKTIQGKLFFTLVFSLLLFASCDQKKQADSPRESVNTNTKPLYFGVPPLYNKEKLTSDFIPLVQYLTKSLNRPVKLILTESYDDLVTQLKATKIDFAIMGPALYVEAKGGTYPELVYLATAKTGSVGHERAFYFSYILTLKESGYRNLEDARGKRFGFVSKHSTSGYKYPLAHFYSHSIIPEEYFKKVVFSGSHEKLTDLLAEKEIEIGATYEENFKRAKAQHGDIFHVVEKLGPIANLAVVANHSLSAKDRIEIQYILGRIPINAVPVAMPYKGYEVLSDRSYDSVRELNEHLSATKEQEREKIAKSIENKNLNNILSEFKGLKVSSIQRTNIIKNSMLHKEYVASGKVTGFHESIYYNSGWILGKNVVEFETDNKLTILILEQVKQKKGSQVKFDFKIVGMMGDSVVVERLQ